MALNPTYRLFERVGLLPLDERWFTIYFAQFALARFDSYKLRVVPLPKEENFDIADAGAGDASPALHPFPSPREKKNCQGCPRPFRLTGEVVSPQTVSMLTRDLDEAVRQPHQSRLSDDYAYLFLDGVSLRVRRPAGCKRVHMLAAYGVRRDGTRQLLAFLRSQGESQADWEALLQDLYRRGGLESRQIDLIVTDGCPGLAAAIPTAYPQARHQRCWSAQDAENPGESTEARLCWTEGGDAGDLSDGKPRAHAETAFRRCRASWLRQYGPTVRRLGRDLPELLSVFAFPRHLWQKLRTTNVIERCIIEVRRRTRPMVCFVNVESVDRIIYSIFQRFNLEWKTRTLHLFTQAA